MVSFQMGFLMTGACDAVVMGIELPVCSFLAGQPVHQSQGWRGKDRIVAS